MKHIRKYEKFKNNETVNESVFQVENTYKVNVIVDVDAKLISAYSKKVKQNTNKDINDMMGNATLAEEMVKWVLKNGLDSDKIPANAIVGGQVQAQSQTQVQSTQAQPEMQPEVEVPETQVQSEVQVQSDGDFENVDSDENLPA